MQQPKQPTTLHHNDRFLTLHVWAEPFPSRCTCSTTSPKPFNPKPRPATPRAGAFPMPAVHGHTMPVLTLAAQARCSPQQSRPATVGTPPCQQHIQATRGRQHPAAH